MKSLYSLLFVLIVGSIQANNMLVQNVTTLGNDAVNKTIQVQFDISWDNSWRDEINYDAAWIFMKFKDANGLWQHVQLNQTGFVNGTGTANTVQVTNDKVGCWLYRTGLGSGTFNSTGMQLQWNYGLAGLSNVTGLEVRVFAVEMVYVPEGEFNCAGPVLFNAPSMYGSFYYSPGNSSFNRKLGVFSASGNNYPVVNSKLSPVLIYNDGTSASIRVKGDAGLDTDNNEIVDVSNYPTGYKAFYCYKYELSENQYADFLNTLTVSQVSNLGIAGANITLTNSQYFSSTPNLACGNANSSSLLGYADWSGIRPISFLEFNKASYGPFQPVYSSGYRAGGTVNSNLTSSLSNVGSLASSVSNRESAGASYYGCMDFTGSAREPVVKLNYFQFSIVNGDGQLSSSGFSDVLFWNNLNMLVWIDQTATGTWNISTHGFRYVRSAE